MEIFDFNDYAKGVIKDIKPLLDFTLPAPKSYKIDWNKIEKLALQSNVDNWDTLPPFKELKAHKKHPVVYYFTIQPAHAESILELFRTSKKISIERLRKGGIDAKDYWNICHVSKKPEKSKYLYVGSRKKDAHMRFKHHLGYGSKQTGALHLTEVFRTEECKPVVTFHYHILDPKYRGLTEHIEFVLQEKLNPVLGRRSIKKEKELLLDL